MSDVADLPLPVVFQKLVNGGCAVCGGDAGRCVLALVEDGAFVLIYDFHKGMGAGPLAFTALHTSCALKYPGKYPGAVLCRRADGLGVVLKFAGEFYPPLVEDKTDAPAA